MIEFESYYLINSHFCPSASLSDHPAQETVLLPISPSLSPFSVIPLRLRSGTDIASHHCPSATLGDRHWFPVSFSPLHTPPLPSRPSHPSLSVIFRPSVIFPSLRPSPHSFASSVPLCFSKDCYLLLNKCSRQNQCG